MKILHHDTNSILKVYSFVNETTFMHAFIFKQVITKLISVLRPLAWHSILQVNLPCTLLKKFGYCN